MSDAFLTQLWCFNTGDDHSRPAGAMMVCTKGSSIYLKLSLPFHHSGELTKQLIASDLKSCDANAAKTTF